MALSEKTRQWLSTQLEGCQPPDTLSAGGIGRAVQELAGATVAFEAGGGQAFGLSLSAEREELTPLATRGRQIMQAWRERLVAEHGSEGAQLVDSIAARYNLTLPSMTSEIVAQSGSEPLPAAIEAVLQEWERAIADDAGRLACWLEAGEIEDDSEGGLLVGQPDQAALEQFFARFEASSNGRLPRVYFELLSRWNGIATRCGESRTVAPNQLGEPVLWPLEAYGDHFQWEAADLEGVDEPFVFAERADSGLFLFDTMKEEAPVFWVARGSAGVPVPVAASLAEFLSALAAHHFSASAVLSAAKVPGWGR